MEQLQERPLGRGDADGKTIGIHFLNAQAVGQEGRPYGSEAPFVKQLKPVRQTERRRREKLERQFRPRIMADAVKFFKRKASSEMKRAFACFCRAFAPAMREGRTPILRSIPPVTSSAGEER